ncbi:hypothetical protein IFM89_027759 [Coptis chinensis]|uniref:Uncharacterized protein n=1 Tax=Coptis chinensis TaxID=261450 RepID=A0A835I695_9MAGN|nr:hypothetical protein IFM89_027759 [Coptis chinensis]
MYQKQVRVDQGQGKLLLARVDVMHVLMLLRGFAEFGNPANELVSIINENRSAQKLPKLGDNPGLGCIALQYIEECNGSCSSNNTLNCQHPEDDFTEIFAPNCGIELPTYGTLSGRIVGCQSKYLKPSEAFSHILFQDKKALSMVKEKHHTEVGVGLVQVEASSKREGASVEPTFHAAGEKRFTCS